ncbi:MAG: NADH-quinone oxidoreductase subunit J [Deltaproteobacteria bacterium]|nr:NADH-quinone oxidoreductase subunit J [Deltaproteobacteria bacterium]
MSELAGAPAGGVGAVVFWASAGLALACALLTVLSGRAIRSAVFLLGTVLSIAVLYTLLDAHFLAAIQVIVYAGAVVVLFVFVIMLLGPGSEVGRQRRMKLTRALGAASLLSVGGVLAWALAAERPEAALPEGFGTVRSVASALFRENVFTFEAVSVLLLVAIIGAVAVAKGKKSQEPRP